MKPNDAGRPEKPPAPEAMNRPKGGTWHNANRPPEGKGWWRWDARQNEWVWATVTAVIESGEGTQLIIDER